MNTAAIGKKPTPVAEFFAIEKDIRGRSAEERRFIRQQRGRPLADAFQKWLRT